MRAMRRVGWAKAAPYSGPHPEEPAQPASRRMATGRSIGHPSRRRFAPPQDEVREGRRALWSCPASAISVATFAIAMLAALSRPAAAESVEEFYRGKTVIVAIGFSVGGGYDLYARLLARHLG